VKKTLGTSTSSLRTHSAHRTQGQPFFLCLSSFSNFFLK
jgi:hypothetical protein